MKAHSWEGLNHGIKYFGATLYETIYHGLEDLLREKAIRNFQINGFIPNLSDYDNEVALLIEVTVQNSLASDEDEIETETFEEDFLFNPSIVQEEIKNILSEEELTGGDYSVNVQAMSTNYHLLILVTACK